MAHVEIRAERPDGEPGRTLLAGYARSIAERYPGWDPGQGPSAEPDEISPPDGRFLVAYVGGDPVACGALKRLDAETAEVKRVYVTPAARGHGVARRLLEALEDEACKAGYTRLRLDTGARLTEAQALFRSAGYIEIPDYNGNPVAAFWFEKRLRP